jgi:hypothetical protein
MAATATALEKNMAATALVSTAFNPRTTTQWHATTEPNFEVLDGSCVAMTAKLWLKTTSDPYKIHGSRRLS